MSVASKRRDTEVFSMAFLDCICCGFGAMLLVFVLSVAQKKEVVKFDVDEAKSRYLAYEQKVVATQEDLDRLKKLLAAMQIDLEQVNALNNQDQLKLTERQKELLLMLEKSGNMKDALAALLGEKKALPTEEKATIPIPQVDRTQYLTGVKLAGDYVVFVVRASGSMLDETEAAAEARLGDSDKDKREAPKWRRVVHSIQWLIATLDPETHFQVLFFNEEVTPILPNRADEWFVRTDRAAMSEIVKKLNEIVPRGKANMEKAFEAVRYLSHQPDNIVLLTDGLPTQSDTLPIMGAATEPQRVRAFDFAVRKLPPRVPVSTILFPMSGDPQGPAKFWWLASRTQGALVSPAKSWPES